MKEYFKINNIDVGFASHSTEGSIFLKGALNTEILVRKGKLRINLLTPALEITDEMHNGLLDDSYYDNLRNVDYLRMTTYRDLAIEGGQYNTQVTCPYIKNAVGFETYGFPERVKFHGIIDVQKGYVHIKGVFKRDFGEQKTSIPVEILKCFDPQPLIPARKIYSLATAENVNPLEVYELNIAKGTFTEFPQEVLGFKNLESIWAGAGTRFEFENIPEEFYTLTKLHTIQFFGTRLKTLSERIGQLQKLEEITIQSSQLSVLPDSICALPQLTKLSFRYNQLLRLPSGIGKLPKLKELDIRGNNFETLPQSLRDIYAVEVDRKHRKYFMDTSYKSENQNPIKEALYDLSNYPVEKLQLEKSILAIPELKEFKDLIVDYSTMATYLILDKEEKEIPIGKSKVGGAPDLPKELEHPTNKNGLLYIFHAQLNCADIAPFQKYLPRTGMLYFFVNDEESVQRPLVLFSKNTQDLSRTIYTEETKFTDGDFDNRFRKVVGVTFQNAVSIPNFYNSSNHGEERYPKYADLWKGLDEDSLYEKIDLLDENVEQLEEKLQAPLAFDNGHIQLRTHSLNSSVFTQHESPQEIAAAKFGGEPTEWLVLLNMESVGEFSLWDAGTLTYCIHKKDLAIGDFSRVSASIESS